MFVNTFFYIFLRAVARPFVLYTSDFVSVDNHEIFGVLLSVDEFNTLMTIAVRINDLVSVAVDDIRHIELHNFFLLFVWGCSLFLSI